ncbi:nuclear transport factor 2 family protein [Streptomyces sp. NA04227]|uniref:nuclear transport factor 2 family protein n=1 Tax=Streptomyces sp. NA04227 TaxID=2742136 RepID=UPI0015921D40|nr:nuclear transport factor 2 family protein [Streptomyces sp. NA04227]QKW07707.1 nuclear transport factor 2 family protein [Streptomyces sp. NA04227]
MSASETTPAATAAPTPAPASAPAPDSAATRALVQEFLGRFGTGDTKGAAALFAEKVDWKINWPEAEHGRAADTPWIIHRTTGAEAAGLFEELGRHHVPEETDTQIERILVDGADAVVLGELRQTARPTGRAYRARFALHLTVENGRFTRYHIYEDSLAVAQAFDTGGGHTAS